MPGCLALAAQEEPVEPLAEHPRAALVEPLAEQRRAALVEPRVEHLRAALVEPRVARLRAVTAPVGPRVAHPQVAQVLVVLPMVAPVVLAQAPLMVAPRARGNSASRRVPTHGHPSLRGGLDYWGVRLLQSRASSRANTLPLSLVPWLKRWALAFCS